MGLFYLISLLILFFCFCHVNVSADIANGELAYNNLLSAINSRVDSVSEVNLKADILKQRFIFDDVTNLDMKSLLGQAYRYLNQNDYHLSQTAPSFNVSELCLNHTKIALGAMVSGETWALKLLDSMGKPPSDLLEGNLAWFGSFDECVKIRAVVRNNVSRSEVQESTPFVGKYCMAFIDALGNSADPNNPLIGMFAMLRVGVCFPDSCSSADTLALINTALSLVPIRNSSLSAAFTTCQENELQYDSKAIAVLVVCCLFIVVIAIATLYDIVVIQLPKQRLLSESAECFNSHTDGYTDHRVNQDEYKPLLGDNDKLTKTENAMGVVGELLLSFSVYTNGKKLLSTKQTSGSLRAVNGIRFLSMSWVILGHTYVFGIYNGATGVVGELLLSFSVYTNGKKILSTKQTSVSLRAVNGIRFLSMSWVILGHSYAFGIYNGANIASFFPEVLGRWTYQAIVNALVSVDSFFTLSGLLMSYLVLKEMKKKDGKINWFMFYFHRFWRLTPPYMLVIMVYVPLFRYMSDGPIWPQNGVEKDYCEHSWWTNLLYINNFLYDSVEGQTQAEGCMAWSWYLANDMQFFVISPILIVPLFYYEIVGLVVCVVMILVVFLSAGIISSVSNMPAIMFGGQADQEAYFVDYYIKPYCRMGPYIIGVVTGYILYKTNCRFRMNRLTNLAGWFIATVLACAILYGLYNPVNGDHILSKDVAALYNATHRTVWGACLCWVIFACATGHGGFVNTILSWTALIPLSRLTYCAYLIHPILMYLYYFSLRQPLYFTDITMVWLFLSFLVVSYGVAFVVSLAFESPMMALEKVIFKRGDKKNS